MTRIRNTKSLELSVDEHLSLLLSEEAHKSACDDTTTVTIDAEELPSWFDEVKFRRGQMYYQENKFAMFMGKFCGLISILAIPSILNILVFTRMSSKCVTAYRRYVATIFHMDTWYGADFHPGSKSWQSMITVRKLHCSVSRRASAAGLGSINQRDMALTQFGFIGYPLIRANFLGISTDNLDNIEGFIHFWRVIGWLLGIDDRINICRESISETKELCEALRERYFAPGIRSRDPTFLCMAAALSQGMWYFNPFITMDTFFAFIFRLTKPIPLSKINNNNNNNKQPNGVVKNENITMKQDNNAALLDYDINQKYPMKVLNRLLFVYFIFILEVLLKYRIFRMYFNGQIRLTLFLVQYFPFLAYYSFGIKESHINISNDKVFL